MDMRNRHYVAGMTAATEGKARFECPIQPTSAITLLHRLWWMHGWQHQEGIAVSRDGVIPVEKRKR